jgi:hypothetical protein
LKALTAEYVSSIPWQKPPFNSWNTKI